jgi:hypothetical protein
VDVAAGGAHSLAIGATGSAIGWGYNFYGQCNVPTLPIGREFESVDAGAFFSASMLDDGSIVAWGEDNAGQCQVPSTPAGVRYRAFSVGIRHGLALRSDGVVVGWGTNGAGEANVPPLSQAYAVLGVSCGDGFSLVLQSSQCGNAMSYCTAGTTVHGCVPSIGGVGTPSSQANSGFDIVVSNMPGQRFGTIFYGFYAGAVPWAPFSPSYQCIAFPVQRTGDRQSGGTAGQCNGELRLDFNAWRTANPGALGSPYVAGQVIHAQGWFRDPGAPKQTNLSDGLRFTLCN